MGKKKIAILLVFLINIMVLSSCKTAVGTAEDNAAPVTQDEVEIKEAHIFGFSGITMDNPYYITLEASLREAIEGAGSTLISKDPGLDSAIQITQIEEMIAEGIEGIFLSPVDWQEIKPALDALKEAGVKIINVDTHVKDVEYVDAYIGSNNKNAGMLCAADLIERHPEGGKIVILEGMNVNSIIERITGFEETLATASNGFTIAVRKDVRGDLNLALEAATEVFAQEENIIAVMCGNDQSALGALIAANTAGLTDLDIYGVDGSPDLKKELAKKETLIAGTAGQSPISMGKEAAQIGLAILNGEKFEVETYTEVFFINQNNLDMYGTDGWQ